MEMVSRCAPSALVSTQATWGVCHSLLKGAVLAERTRKEAKKSSRRPQDEHEPSGSFEGNVQHETNRNIALRALPKPCLVTRQREHPTPSEGSDCSGKEPPRLPLSIPSLLKPFSTITETFLVTDLQCTRRTSALRIALSHWCIPTSADALLSDPSTHGSEPSATATTAVVQPRSLALRQLVST
ncbi:hypothetical protein VDGL01_05610 [Verticillium dahliae]